MKETKAGLDIPSDGMIHLSKDPAVIHVFCFMHFLL